jgi:hypothetical protein
MKTLLKQNETQHLRKRDDMGMDQRYLSEASDLNSQHLKVIGDRNLTNDRDVETRKIHFTIV